MKKRVKLNPCLPCQKYGNIMVIWVVVIFEIDLLLKLTETLQRVVSMVGDHQILLKSNKMEQSFSDINDNKLNTQNKGTLVFPQELNVALQEKWQQILRADSESRDMPYHLQYA